MREAVIVAAVRSPVGRAGKGGLAHTRADEIAIQVIEGLLAAFPSLERKEVDDVIYGSAFPEAETGMNVGRIVALGAGLPVTTSGMTVNRFCSSGLQALATATATIRAGWSDIAVAGGCDSMSHIAIGGFTLRPNPDWGARPPVFVSMGITAENIAERYHISRSEQDMYSIESNRRAYEAIQAGKFREEIIPIQAYSYKIDKAGKRFRETGVFDRDDGVRWPTTLEAMAKLPSPFKIDGSVTAGNSSQMSDGAAFALIMTTQKAEKLGLKPVARLSHYAVAGCEPDEMGVGPYYAIPKVLRMAGLTMDQIDLFEINEAFAVQMIYCLRALEIEKRWEKGDVNPNGGAIALGHPLGGTGAKLTAQLLAEMKRRGARRGIVSMCIGGGMGAAAIFEML